MQIAAITRFKHGDIYALLKKLNWSQSELARRAGLPITTIARIINLQRRPLREHAERIQRAFGEAGEYIDILAVWPESFNGVPSGYKIERTQDVEMLSLSEVNVLALPAPEAYDSGLEDGLKAALNTLPERERIIVSKYFEEEGNFGWISKIAKEHNITVSRVTQIVSKALMKLRRRKAVELMAEHIDLSQFDNFRQMEASKIAIQEALQATKRQLDEQEYQKVFGTTK